MDRFESSPCIVDNIPCAGMISPPCIWALISDMFGIADQAHSIFAFRTTFHIGLAWSATLQKKKKVKKPVKTVN